MSHLSAIRRSLPTGAWWTASTCLAVLFLYPLYVMVSQSLKKPSDAAQVPPTMFPHGLPIQNYRTLSHTGSVSFLQHVTNSVVVAVGATLATVLLATLAGYGFSKRRFPGSNVVFFAILATFMIPFQAIITPLYSILHTLGLQNTLLGLALVYTTFQRWTRSNQHVRLPGLISPTYRIDPGAVHHALTLSERQNRQDTRQPRWLRRSCNCPQG